MASAPFELSKFAGESLPDLCMVCGRPTTLRVTRELSQECRKDGNPHTVTVAFDAPLCGNHAGRPWKRSKDSALWIGAAVAVMLGGPAIAVATEQTAFIGTFWIGFAALIVALLKTRSPIRLSADAAPGGTRIEFHGIADNVARTLRGEAVSPTISLARTPRRIAGTLLAGFGTTIALLSGVTTAGILKNSIDRPKYEASRRERERNEDIVRGRPYNRNSSDSPSEFPAYGYFVLAAVGGIGIWLRGYGKSLHMPRVEELLAVDPRPLVLYLRAFDDDEAGHIAEQKVPWLNNWNLPSGFGATVETITFEEVLAQELTKYGPVVAIARPLDRRSLPPVGAARVWVPDDQWKDKVNAFLVNCRSVVLLLGKITNEKGLAWEWAQLQAHVPPEKIILVMPPVEVEEARARWNGFQSRSGNRLPNYREGLLAARFDANWNCELFACAAKLPTGAELHAALGSAPNWSDRRWTPAAGEDFPDSVEPAEEPVPDPAIEAAPAVPARPTVDFPHAFVCDCGAMVLVQYVDRGRAVPCPGCNREHGPFDAR